MSLTFSQLDRSSELWNLSATDIKCEDCGRTKRLQSRQLRAIVRDGTRTLMGLHNRLYCSACRDRGGEGRNIDLKPIYRFSDAHNFRVGNHAKDLLDPVGVERDVLRRVELRDDHLPA